MKRKMLKVGIPTGIVVAFFGAALRMHIYFLQDMLAELLFFSISFSIIAVMILILYLLDQGLYRAVAYAGRYAVLAAAGLRAVGQFGKKRFRFSGLPTER